MHLKVVGVHSSERQDPTEVKRQSMDLLDEETPFIDETTQKSVQNEQKMQFKAKFLINQDPRKSKFCHGKLIVIEKIIFFLNIVIFFLSVGKTQADIYNKKPGGLTANYIMEALSSCICGLAIICWCRSLSNYELQVQQNKTYIRQGDSILRGWFRDNERITSYLKQLFIIMLHPNKWFEGYTFSMTNTLDGQNVIFSINDILSLLLILKVYIVIRSLITLSSYSSPRASRLCYRSGLQHNQLFVIKCILHEQPLSAIGLCFFTILIIFGYGLKVSQGVLFLHNQDRPKYSFTQDPNYQNYSNCFWLVFITMTTVGYGDIYPKTLPGRVVIFFVATTGVLLSSLLIVSLSIYLQMESKESKAHLTLMRLQYQADLLRQGSKALVQTIKIRQQQGKVDKNLQKQFIFLKKEIDLIKTKSRQIKSLVDTDNIVEQMDRLFFILKDCLKDIYENQAKLKQEISKIKEIQSIKLSFIKQVSQMLHKCQNLQSLKKKTFKGPINNSKNQL